MQVPTVISSENRVEEKGVECVDVKPTHITKCNASKINAKYSVYSFINRPAFWNQKCQCILKRGFLCARRGPGGDGVPLKPKSLQHVPRAALRHGNIQLQMFKSSAPIFFYEAFEIWDLWVNGRPDIERKGCKALDKMYRTIHKCSKGGKKYSE